MAEKTRTFDGGATRNSEEDKLDYEGFLSDLVIERYAQYLHSHRALEDGTLRDSDNWQRGMPLSVYMKSAWRHLVAWWSFHRMQFRGRYPNHKLLEDAICGVIFNASGYLHELLVEPRENVALEEGPLDRRKAKRRTSGRLGKDDPRRGGHARRVSIPPERRKS